MANVNISRTEVIDNPAKDHFSATIARCYRSNYDFVLEFAVDDDAPTYTAVTIVASEITIRELLRLSSELNVQVGTPDKWKPDSKKRVLVAPPRRATLFHVSIAGSHEIAILSPATFDMLSLMSALAQPGPVLSMPAFLSINLSLKAFADLLSDIKNCVNPG